MQKQALGKDILLVEDEPEIRQLLCRVLSRDGHVVDTAADGGEAQGMIQKKCYELIIIDLRLPIVNGKQLFQHIYRQYPELTKKVILTAEETLTEGPFLAETACPVLEKPFTLGELKAIVKNSLASRN